MKKRGFTLAEVMIALTLIGVIASLTVPTFVANSKNKANAAKLATTVTAVENAFTSMLVSEGVNTIEETAFGREANAANLAGHLSQYIKLAGHQPNVNAYYGTPRPFTTLSGAVTTPGASRIFETKNGAYLFYLMRGNNNWERTEDVVRNFGGSVTSFVGTLCIDVNGSLQPNKWGRDLFQFGLGSDGVLYPAGGLDFSIIVYGNNTNLWNQAGSNNICTNNAKERGCTARLIENNYEIDY